jgi:hypothetical protein
MMVKRGSLRSVNVGCDCEEECTVARWR